MMFVPTQSPDKYHTARKAMTEFMATTLKQDQATVVVHEGDGKWLLAYDLNMVDFHDVTTTDGMNAITQHAMDTIGVQHRTVLDIMSMRTEIIDTGDAATGRKIGNYLNGLKNCLRLIIKYVSSLKTGSYEESRCTYALLYDYYLMVRWVLRFTADYPTTPYIKTITYTPL